MINGDDFWLTKIAGGPYDYPMNGMMLAISTKSGKPLAIILDNGYLTHLRTAMAGFICAKYLAPKNIIGIGVIGTGTQAKMQVEILKKITSCKKVYVWGRNIKKCEAYKIEMYACGFYVVICNKASDVAQKSNIIITTTSSIEPILFSKDIQAGTHITAIGADEPGKQELESKLIKEADICVVDSVDQCIDHGEVSHAFKEKLISKSNLRSLASIILEPSKGRSNQNQISISDLTGVAVQDIQISKSVFEMIK